MPAYKVFRNLLGTTQPDSHSLLRVTVHTKIELRTGLLLSVQIDDNTSGPSLCKKRKTIGLDSSITETDVGTIVGLELKKGAVSGRQMGSGSGPIWNPDRFIDQQEFGISYSIGRYMIQDLVWGQDQFQNRHGSCVSYGMGLGSIPGPVRLWDQLQERYRVKLNWDGIGVCSCISMRSVKLQGQYAFGISRRIGLGCEPGYRTFKSHQEACNQAKLNSRSKTLLENIIYSLYT